MNRIEQIAQHSDVQAALRGFEKRQARAIDLIINIQQIPAPTFDEAARAAFVEKQMRALGLVDVRQDALNNVYGRFPGSGNRGKAPPVIVTAHSDTVFPAGTDLRVRHNGRYIYGPGIGDNATGVAGLLLLAEALRRYRLQPPADIWLVANVGEEGMGDLRGMRAVVHRFGPQASYIVVEGGLHGQIAHQAIGVSRYRITVEADGGHSWGNFGEVSAVHELSRIVAGIAELQVPETPKTSFNVGTIEGGTSVNTIAQQARALLDLRSEEEDTLVWLVGRVREVIQKVKRQVRRRGQSVRVQMTQVGNRPAGHIPRSTPLVVWAEQALRYIDCEQVVYISGSTDANIPLSRGIAAVCVGLTVSGNAHRLDEFIDPTALPGGMQQLLLLTLAAAGFDH